MRKKKNKFTDEQVTKIAQQQAMLDSMGLLFFGGMTEALDNACEVLSNDDQKRYRVNFRNN